MWAWRLVFWQTLPVTPIAEEKAPIEPKATREGEEARADAVGAEGAGEAVAHEIGGREGPEPTRFGDWELRGRCIDF
jgi:hypothetical protein